MILMPSQPVLAIACWLAVGCSSTAGPSDLPVSPSTSTAGSLATASDRFLTETGVRLRFREMGQGDPVLLLHGYSGRLEDWAGVADSLSRDHRVIIVDQRGFGESSKFSDPAGYGRAMVDDVILLLDGLAIQRAHLVGHSMGALVAANVAVRHADRVATASLIAGPFYADSTVAAQALAPWVADLEGGEGLRDFALWLFPGISDSVALESSRRALATNDLPALIAVMRSIGALMISRGTTVHVPVLVAVGTSDPLLPQSRDLAAWWPGARLLEVDGANHGSVLQHEEVLSAVRSLVEAGKSDVSARRWRIPANPAPSLHRSPVPARSSASAAIPHRRP